MIETHEEAIAVIRRSVDQLVIDQNDSIAVELCRVINWINTQQNVSDGKDIIIRQLNDRLGN